MSDLEAGLVFSGCACPQCPGLGPTGAGYLTLVSTAAFPKMGPDLTSNGPTNTGGLALSSITSSSFVSDLESNGSALQMIVGLLANVSLLPRETGVVFSSFIADGALTVFGFDPTVNNFCFYGSVNFDGSCVLCNSLIVLLFYHLG